MRRWTTPAGRSSIASRAPDCLTNPTNPTNWTNLTNPIGSTKKLLGS